MQTFGQVAWNQDSLDDPTVAHRTGPMYRPGGSPACTRARISSGTRYSSPGTIHRRARPRPISMRTAISCLGLSQTSPRA